MYRRLFAELSKEHDIFHVVGFRRNGRSPAELDRAYQTQIDNVRPVCLTLNPVMRAVYRLRRTALAQRSKAFPGVVIRSQMARIFEAERPELIWWSSDYLPDSFSALYALRDQLAKCNHLHVGILDPPECLAHRGRAAMDKAMALHRECLKFAGSVSCIGKNLQQRIQAETDKPVFILNDFVETNGGAAAKPRPPDGVVRVGISGRIYKVDELQDFVKALGAAFTQSEVLWYGDCGQKKICEQLLVPANVRVTACAAVPRNEIVGVLRGACDLAYLSMPEARPEFARYSVPTKLVTYVEAGLPVAFHAPPDSEVHSLNVEHGFGFNLTGAPNANDGLRDLITHRSRHVAGLNGLREARYEKGIVMNTLREILAQAKPARRGS